MYAAACDNQWRITTNLIFIELNSSIQGRRKEFKIFNFYGILFKQNKIFSFYTPLKTYLVITRAPIQTKQINIIIQAYNSE